MGTKTPGRLHSKHHRHTSPQSPEDDDPSSLLHDLHALNAALSLSKSPPPSTTSAPTTITTLPPPSRNPNPPKHTKPFHILKWRPFKALSHIGNRRFQLLFTLRVYSIRGLPSDLNGCSISVYFRRAGSPASSASHTPAVRVSRGSAEFHEVLEEHCHVYGHETSHRGPAKYEPRQFVVSAVIIGSAKRASLGENRFDVTSLLPSSLEELEKGDSTGERTITFHLGGRGKGAAMIVTFGFSTPSIAKRAVSLGGSGRKMRDLLEDAGQEENASLRRAESLSGIDRVSKTHASTASGVVTGEAATSMPSRMEVVDAEVSEKEALCAREADGESSCVTSDDVKSRSLDEGSEVTSSVQPKLSDFYAGRKVENPEERKTLAEIEEVVTSMEFPDVEEVVTSMEFPEDDMELVEVDGKLVEHDDAEVLNGVHSPLDKHVDVDVGETFAREEFVEEKEIEETKFTVIEHGVEIEGVEHMMVSGDQPSLKVGAGWSDGNVVSKEVGENALEEVSGISERGIHHVGVTSMKDLDGVSIVEPFSNFDSSGAKLESSVFHEVSTLEKLDSAQVNLEDAVIAELSIIESSNLVDSPQPKLEKHVPGELSTLQAPAPVNFPLSKLEDHVSDETPYLVGDSPKAKLDDSAFDGIYIAESLPPIVSSQAELDNMYASNGISVCGSSMPQDSSQAELENPGLPDDMEVQSNQQSEWISKSLSFDDMTESVANEFLTMLGLSSDSDLESPRERLLKQFSKEDAWKQFESASSSDMESPKELLWRKFKAECSANGGGMLCPDPESGTDSVWVEEMNLRMMVQAGESEQGKLEQEMISKERAQWLEDKETEDLMHKMGLNKKAFQSSPPGCGYDFDSPFDSPQEKHELPYLADGVGPCVQLRDGGFLRSMNPSLLRDAKNNGSLIMQASSPIVLPAELGSGIIEILQGLASIGIEKLSMQARKLMPLEDVTGKSMQQVAWEALPSLERNERLCSDFSRNVDDGKRKGRASYSRRDVSGSDYVSLEDLAPLAMDKIEALSIEGLRIQSDMSEEEAPGNIFSQSLAELSAHEGKGSSKLNTLGLEGAVALQLLDLQNAGDDVDGLMGLSLSLDEWMRLDSGVVDEKDVGSERTAKILAAHHAKSADLVSGCRKGGKGSGKWWGLLGDSFTVALMVQLRDPTRDYEPVGTPMLSLVQVERVFVPPKPKIYSNVSSARGIGEECEDPEKKPEPKPELLKKEEETPVPQFKITEVHVAGLKQEQSKKTIWGNPTQRSSGSRWLLAAGMGKTNKNPFMKSKTVGKPSESTTTVQPGDTLWSISSRTHGTGKKWKELAALNPHIRNPNVIFPNQTLRLH